MVICVLLIIQFFLGMIANLFVTVPAHHPGTSGSNYFARAASSVIWAIGNEEVWLAIHAALGLALALVSLRFIGAAIRGRDRLWITVTIAGSLTLIGAGFNGASFLTFGKNLSSLLMSGLFALSLGSYLAGLYVSGRPLPAAVAGERTDP